MGKSDEKTQQPMPAPTSSECKGIFGPKHAIITCPFCHNIVKTHLKHTTTVRTHIAAALCWWCCCIPLCCDSAKNTDHYCPKCNIYLGTYER